MHTEIAAIRGYHRRSNVLPRSPILLKKRERLKLSAPLIQEHDALDRRKAVILHTTLPSRAYITESDW